MRRTFYIMLFSLYTAFVFAQNTLKITVADALVAAKQVDSLLKTADEFISKQDFENALAANNTAEHLALEKFGRESVKYAEVRNKHGWIHECKLEYPEAAKMYLESLMIFEKVLGKNDAVYAKKLNNLANFYRDTGEHLKSEATYVEAMQSMGNAFGFEHPNYAKVVNNLAILYWQMGLFEKAELNFIKAQNIREIALGKESLDYAGSLVNLGTLYSEFGLFERGLQHLKEAKDIFVNKLKITAHPFYMNCVNNLGGLYMQMGYHENAEPLYVEALGVAEKLSGKISPGYARSLNNLSILYRGLGDFEKAERLMFETKDIWEKVYGTEHIEFVKCLLNLGIFYEQTAKIQKAALFLQEAQPKIIKIVGKEHKLYISSVAEFAILNAKMGNRLQSKTLFHEALRLQEKLFGKENAEYLKGLANLGVFYMDSKNYDKAEECLNEALFIGEKTLGKSHPYCVESLQNLAKLHENKNSYAQADLFYQEYFTRVFAQLDQATTFLSEREIGKFIQDFQVQADRLNGVLLVRPNIPNRSMPQTAYDNVLFLKGFLQMSAARIQKLSTGAVESAELSEQLKSSRRRLAAEYAKPIAEQKGVAELEEKANSVEKELVRTVAGYAENAQQVHWQDVKNQLKPGEAAIEFVHFRVNYPQVTDSVMYAALLLLPAAASAEEDWPQTAQPVFIPLFEEKTLDALLKTAGARKSDYVNRVYGAQNAGEKTLYQMIWQPIEKELEGLPAIDLSKAGKKTIYFSPSGLLHRLKLEAISISALEGAPERAVLADRYHFVQVSSTRSLVDRTKAGQLPENQATSANSGAEALLFGGIQFDMDENAISKANAKLATRTTEGTRGEPDFSQTDSTARLACQSLDNSRGGDWSYLNWTEKEVDALSPILTSADLKPTLLKGYLATEEAFKSINIGGVSNPSDVKTDVKSHSPRILHIATHGYFFSDPNAAPIGAGAPVFKLSEQPMIRSGLILAGGNYAWKKGAPLKPGMEDGILTAYEISQMDLSNTELVVLSACETGLGDIQGNEGVYGLQRAFKIAGAKYVIMSLWQVPDFQTQELMVAFYKNWLLDSPTKGSSLADKMPLPEAFRLAQKEMREKYEHPYFWAGFVLLE